MADLTTIPDPPSDHTEIFRVLLTATAATANLSPGRGGAVTQTGSPTFITDGTVETILDGIRPWDPGSSQGDIRLRRTGANGFDQWVATLPSGTTYRLRMATTADSSPDTVRTMTERNVGGGFWNWFAPNTPDDITTGDTVALALDVDVDYGQAIAASDAELSVEAGSPTVATTPTFMHTSNAELSVEAGEPTVAFAPETTIPSTNATFIVEAGEPTVHVDLEFIAPSHAGFSSAAGLPGVAVYPEFIAPSFAAFHVQADEPTVYIDKGFRNASFDAQSGTPTVRFVPEAVKERNPAAEAAAHQVSALQRTTTAALMRRATAAMNEFGMTIALEKNSYDVMQYQVSLANLMGDSDAIGSVTAIDAVAALPGKYDDDPTDEVTITDIVATAAVVTFTVAGGVEYGDYLLRIRADLSGGLGRKFEARIPLIILS